VAKVLNVPCREMCLQKAGGDMKKSGKPDPYAYVPLERQFLNKRQVVFELLYNARCFRLDGRHKCMTLSASFAQVNFGDCVEQPR
jgi:hypothetical protein